MAAEELEGWTLQTVGSIARKVGVPLGTIACPNCGVIGNGVIEPVCPFCDKPYWRTDTKESANLQAHNTGSPKLLACEDCGIRYVCDPMEVECGGSRCLKAREQLRASA